MGEYKMYEAKILHKQGKKVKEIAERLDVTRRTVSNYLHGRVFQGRKRGRPRGSVKLFPFFWFIDGELDRDLYLNGEVLLDKLRKIGYTGGKTILGDYLRFKREQYRIQAVMRFETVPGKQAQVDWSGPYYYREDGITKKRYCFLMKAGYSRSSYMEFTHSKEQSVLLACHIRAFIWFGGVFEEILYDNEKTMFLYSASKDKWYAHPFLAAFAAHYGFTPKRCRTRRPQTKGKVEREVRYLNSSFFPSVGNAYYISTEALNEKLWKWLKRVDEKILREHGQSRKERFKVDLKNMRPLPSKHFDYRKQEPLKVDREGYFSFRTNRYSVPATYIGKRLTGYHDPDTGTMDIYSDGHFIKRVILSFAGANKKISNVSDRASVYKAWKKGRDFQQKQAHKAAMKRKLKADKQNSIQDPSVYDLIFCRESAQREGVAA